MTRDEFNGLLKAGILGASLEFIDGKWMMGGYVFHFTPEMAADAATLGIGLPTCDTVAGTTPELAPHGMHDSPPATVAGIDHGFRPAAALPARQLTVEEYDRLGEIGVLGEQVELIDGRITFGRYPFAFSEEALAAARAAGIELDEPESRPGYRLASLGTPSAPSDDAEALALTALIEHANPATIARAEHALARDGAERNDTRMLAAADRLREARKHRHAATPDDPAHRRGPSG